MRKTKTPMVESAEQRSSAPRYLRAARMPARKPAEELEEPQLISPAPMPRSPAQRTASKTLAPVKRVEVEKRSEVAPVRAIQPPRAAAPHTFRRISRPRHSVRRTLRRTETIQRPCLDPEPLRLPPTAG